MSLPPPPIAERRPHSNEAHGVSWDDDWNWLRDPGYPNVTDADVLDYLKAENAYFEAAMKPHEALVETLFQEMKAPHQGGRQERSRSATATMLYWSEFKAGTQYRDWYRASRSRAARPSSSTPKMPRPRARNISAWARLRSAPTPA